MQLTSQHKKIVFVLIAAAVVALLFGWFLLEKQKAEQEPLEAQPQGLTKEEILESLNAPADSDVRGLTDQEKDQILESLSAPNQ